MRQILLATLILGLSVLPALAEGTVRPKPRPSVAATEVPVSPRPLYRPEAGSALAMAAAKALVSPRPQRRPGAGIVDATPRDPGSLIESALPPLPEPAPVVLPPGPDEIAEAPRAPRDRLDPAPEASVMVLSTSTAPRLPDAAAAVRGRFVSAPAPALGPLARQNAMPETVLPAALVMSPFRPARRPAADAATPRPEVSPMVSPRPRPRVAVAAAATQAVPAVLVRTAPVPAIEVRPAKRPKGIAAPRSDDEAEVTLAAAVRVPPSETLVRPKKGSVCGDPSIRGEKLAPIPAQVRGCGIAEPVRVTEVDGVRLSVPATLDCDAARALKAWVVKGLKPAFGKKGVTELRIAASYACRSRNNIKGARISEHGRGNAIDIAAVTLRNGTVIDVLRDYRRDAGKPLRQAHKAACGIFGTTLGPGSDGYHENHLHFDVARHRGGPYCR